MKQNRIPYWSLILWIFLWEGVSIWMGEGIFFPSPSAVITRFFQLFSDSSFYSRLLLSTGRIYLGLSIGIILGIIFAILGHKYRWFHELIYPILTITTAVPVVSIIILLLIFFSSKTLSTIISFSMVWPMVYANVKKSLTMVDEDLIEMADVFQVPTNARIKAIYFPKILPSLSGTLDVAVGLGWKSGMAAEVIGLPTLSIGEMLYNAKIYLSTTDLFAWTLIVLILSIMTRKLIHLIMISLQKIR